MFDFLGIISPEKPVFNNPFDFLQVEEIIRVEVGLLQSGSFSFWMLNAREDDVFTGEGRSLILYGNCYIKFDEPAFDGKRKLTAADLAEIYEKTGDGFIHKLKGSFAIVMLNPNDGSVKVFTDPLNLRSIYYSISGKQLVISSSLNALAAILGQKKESLRIDSRAVLDHYLFDFVLDDHTYLQGVREIPPGAMLESSGGEVKVKPYFDPFSFFDLSGPKMGREEGAEQLKKVLAQNVALYTEGPEHTAVALTGGFDSRSIVALLEDSADYTFYSYGKKGSWDIRIPQMIAEELNLNYTPIFLEDDYEKAFPRYAKLALLLSDGIAELTHANIAYVYGNFLKPQASILTGLFGSELIKTPSSRGLFLDENMIGLLKAADPVSALKNLFRSVAGRAGEWFPVNGSLEEEIVEMVRVHPFINNDLPPNEKYFYYLLMVGMRKYFRKEIRIQKPWKNNLHPYLDLDFISVLLKTPFPWVYNFSQKKSLVKNIAIHRLYGEIIHTNPALSNIISTHGYRPRYLLRKRELPLLALEYFRYKKKISRMSGLNFQRSLAFDMIERDGPAGLGNSAGFPDIEAWKSNDPRNYLKMASLQFWLQSRGVSMNTK
jgi:hypothetical protein